MKEIGMNGPNTLHDSKIIPKRKGELFISVIRLLRRHCTDLQSTTNGS